MSEIPYVLGIDPSLTGTAVAKYFTDGSHDVERFSSKNLGKSVRERDQRYLRLTERIMDFIGIEEGEPEPAVICIENYAFDAQNRGMELAEYGGILRSDLCVFGSPIEEVAPATLKKFVTGSGRADKAMMAAKTLNNWKVGFATDDHFDAFGLARVAACLAGFEPPENIKQAECLKTITGRTFRVGVVSTPAQSNLTLPFERPNP